MHWLSLTDLKVYIAENGSCAYTGCLLQDHNRTPCGRYTCTCSREYNRPYIRDCWLQIEKFWQVYNHIISPKDMDHNSNLHYFKEGIQPLWEDPANQEGGKWVLTIKNDPDGLTNCWMEVVSPSECVHTYMLWYSQGNLPGKIICRSTHAYLFSLIWLTTTINM